MNSPQSEMTKRMMDREGMQRALDAGFDSALHRHAAAGVPVVIWRNGKVVEVSAESLLAERARTQLTPR